MFLFAQDPQTECICNSSGFKGFLDTNLFRASDQYAMGTLLDNRNFVSTAVCDLTLGWIQQTKAGNI